MKIGDTKLVNLDHPDGRNPTLRIVEMQETSQYGTVLICVNVRTGATLRVSACRWNRPLGRKKAVPTDQFGRPLAGFGEAMRDDLRKKTATTK